MMAIDPNWTPAEPLDFVAPGSQQMAVAVVGEAVHVVWVQAKTLYHTLMVNGAWQTPVKVAGGEQPALAAAPDGNLYCTYANWFLGNRDIYISRWANEKWSLSQVVSRTTGESSDPSISIAPEGRVHLAWADTTPGDSVIYHGMRDANAWTYAPIPNGKGSHPSIAVNANAVFTAWQERPASSTTGSYEVLVAEKRNGEWTLPAMVSDSREVQSLLPHVAVNSSDQCHVVWQEERDGLFVILHSDLWPNGWDAPFLVSDPAVDSRLGLAFANPLGSFQFLWSEGAILKHRVRGGEPKGAWEEPEIVCEDCPGLSELAAALSARGELHVVFSRWPNGGERHFYYARRKALAPKKIFLPVVLG